VRVDLPTSWPQTVADAEAMQEELRPRLVLDDPGPTEVRTAAGLDVAYDEGSDRLAGAAVVLDARTLAPVDRAVAVGRTRFPYVPGLFAFRELPALADALRGLRGTPDLLVCDGHGIAHPRRFGLACHLGVLTGLPTVGVAKTPLIGRWDEPGPDRGQWSPLTDDGEVVGRALRTRTAVKPVFVSVGSGIDLDSATRHVLALTRTYRLPETTRAADHLARAELVRRPTSPGTSSS
jgi:deoxyribonuclease V